MKIETKFDCGQWVNILLDNKVYLVEIENIHISIIGGIRNSPEYTLYKNPVGERLIFPQSELFETKQDLLNSL